MHRRAAVVAALGTLVAALAVPAVATPALAGTVVSSDGIVSITVPDVQGLPHEGFANYPYAVTIANLPSSSTAWTLTLSMTKVGGLAKTPQVIPGVGDESVPNLFRTLHLKTDPLNGAGRYTWTASLQQTGGPLSTASITTTFLAPSEVFITRTPPPVAVGKQYYFTGQVKYFRSAVNAYFSTGVVTLTLFWLPAGSSTWIPAGTTTTNSNGKFLVIHYGAVSGTWDVLYPGTASVAASSHTVPVTVI